MPVQEFECQIARGQIGRYLSGEALSSEGIRQLGAHVAECSECKTFLDHRKATLQGMLGEAPHAAREEVRAVVETSPSETLIEQIRARYVEDEPAQVEAATPSARTAKPVLTKPILYCGLLAIVLVGMTYITKNPNGLLGPRASQAVAQAPTPDAGKKALAQTETPKPSITPPGPTPQDAKSASPATTSATPPKPTDTTPTSAADKAAADKNSPTTIAFPPKNAGVTISPTRPPSRPLVLSSKPGTQPQSGKPVNPVDAGTTPTKAAANAGTLNSALPQTTKPNVGRKPARKRRHFWHRLRPGTGTIHVYRS